MRCLSSTLRTVDNGLTHSWVTAPSGSAGAWALCSGTATLCRIAARGFRYLGRPWRTGKSGAGQPSGGHIAPEGFAGWNDRTDSDLARFAEAGNTGAGACPRGPWVQALDETQAGALLYALTQAVLPE